MTEPSIDKAIFRSSYTNCAENPKNAIRNIAHIKSIQHPNYIDAAVTYSKWTYDNYKNSKLYTENIPYHSSKEKWMTPNDQLKYKYILNLDGFASAFRIIKELYYDRIIIIPDSPYTYVIRYMLIEWVHYVPCSKNLDNLVNTIK